MQTMTRSYRGFSLLFRLNADRLLMAGAIVVALAVGGLVGSSL